MNEQEPPDIAINQLLSNVQGALRAPQDPATAAGYMQAEATLLLAQVLHRMYMGQAQLGSKLDDISAAVRASQ